MPRRFILIITISAITLLSAAVVWLTTGQAVSDPSGLAHTAPQGPGLERYVDSIGGFFFDYPAGLKIFVVDDGDSRYVFGDAPDGETHFLISIYPSPVSEFTEDYLLDQSWAVEFNAPLERLELPSGVTAFVSGRDNEALGVTRDAFFTRDGVAYQVSAVTNVPDLLSNILQTWHFSSPSL